MKKVVKVLSLIGLTSLVLASCSTTGPSTTIINRNNKSALYNSTWKLVEDGEVVKGLNNQDVSLVINNDDFKVTGFAGCNHFNTSAELNSNQIKFGPVASTKMSCPNSATENSFLSVFDKVDRYEIKGNELFLYKGNLLLLQFKQ